MKKFFLFFVLMLIFISNCYCKDIAPNAKSAIMIEASTGEIMYEKEKDTQLPMASMTKMMTMLLIIENINKGNLSWDEKVKASSHASSMGGSQIFLEPGEEMSVSDLLKGIAIGSGNDAAVTMAERIGGSEEGFVQMMNDRAKELGLLNTHFDNACGLDSDTHYSSSYDMAMIAKELVKYDKILEYTGTYEDYLRKDTDNSFWLVNTNKLVRYYKGVDGLKTGYTDKALYCITTTAIRDGMRLITVVMGEPSSNIRNSETTALLDYGYNMYKLNKLISTDTVVDTRDVSLGKEKKVNIVPINDVSVLSLKSEKISDVKYEFNVNDIIAPIKKGDIVGSVNIVRDGKIINKVSLTVSEDILKTNIIVSYYRNLLNVIRGYI